MPQYLPALSLQARNQHLREKCVLKNATRKCDAPRNDRAATLYQPFQQISQSNREPGVKASAHRSDRHLRREIVQQRRPQRRGIEPHQVGALFKAQRVGSCDLARRSRLEFYGRLPLVTDALSYPANGGHRIEKPATGARQRTVKAPRQHGLQGYQGLFGKCPEKTQLRMLTRELRKLRKTSQMRVCHAPRLSNRGRAAWHGYNHQAAKPPEAAIVR